MIIDHDVSIADMQSYSQVGEFDIELDNRIMVSHQSGPFNLAYAEAYTREAAKVGAQLNASGPYAALTVFTDSMLYAPDALDFTYGRARSDAQQHSNCVAVAIVAGPGLHGAEVMRPWVDKYFEHRGLDAERGRFFSDPDQARTWLQEKLDSAGVK